MRVVFCALRADFTFPIAGAVGTALLTGFLALWQVLIPSEHGDNMRGVLAITSTAAASRSPRTRIDHLGSGVARNISNAVEGLH